MNAIPEEFQIKTLLRYLFSGWGVEKMGRSNISVFSTISSKTNTNQQYWDIPFMGEKKAGQ
jgi:hypothetical protein